MHRITSCRICGNPDLVPVLSLGTQALTGVFPRALEEKITSGPLELVKCHGSESCSLLQLAHSYDSAEMYGENYGYRSGLNQSMVAHLRQKIEHLQRIAPLDADDVVLDIGSNDGTLLSAYPQGPALFGMDPTAQKFRRFYQDRIRVVPDFFSAERFLQESGGRRARIVTSIAMLYDLEDPLSFIRQVASVLADDGIWHFEQSYMPLMLKMTAYDTICHEHVEYYGLFQIEWMLERCGLKLLDVQTNLVNGGSFAVTAAPMDSPLAPATDAIDEIRRSEASLGLDALDPYIAFSLRVREHKQLLCDRVGEVIRSGGLLLGYGASTKGNVILQYCGFGPSEIPAIAEVNPDKFGAFTPGTGIPIISEEQAHAMRPSHLLVLPWHFRENLIQRESAFLAGGGKMLFPLPAIEILSR